MLNMDRIHAVENMAFTILGEIADDVEKMEAVAHLTAVAKFSFLLASRRSLNPELAYISGILHDLYAFTHDRREHALHGSILASGVLKSLNIFTQQEIDVVVSAIKHHSDKKKEHDPMDEVLKDADVMDHFLSDPFQSPSMKDYPRFRKLKNELEILLA